MELCRILLCLYVFFLPQKEGLASGVGVKGGAASVLWDLLRYPCSRWLCGELDAAPSPASRLLVAKSKARAVTAKSLTRCKLS